MKNIMKYYVILIILALTAGCASVPKEKIPTVFYPPAPDLPRIQYLTSILGESDIAPKKSAFEIFVTGVGESQRRLDKPYGVAMSNGKIYVCDENVGLVYFDLVKRTYGPYPGTQGLGRLILPLNIRISPDGYKYVSDPSRGQVVVYDKNDFYVDAFGDPDSWKPVDAVPYQDELYVIDRKSNEIDVLDRKTGSVLRKFGQQGEQSEHLAVPTNLAFDSQGHILVSDLGRFQIVKYDRDGHYFGSIGELGLISGQFARPKGVAVDHDDNLYAVDSSFGNVQIFNKDGHILSFFGQNGEGPGDMNLPVQVYIDYNNLSYFQKYLDPKFSMESLIVVTNQAGRSALSFYALGKERGKHYPTDAEIMEELKARAQKAEAQKAEKGQITEKKPEADTQKP